MVLSGLAVGEGTLVVPAGSTLVAYAGANVGSGIPTNTTALTLSGSTVAGTIAPAVRRRQPRRRP